MIPEFGLTMQITDPLNNNNNVARSTHKFFYLKVIFLRLIIIIWLDFILQRIFLSITSMSMRDESSR